MEDSAKPYIRGFINVYKNNKEYQLGQKIYSSKEEALKVSKYNKNYIATIFINNWLAIR